MIAKDQCDRGAIKPWRTRRQRRSSSMGRAHLCFAPTSLLCVVAIGAALIGIGVSQVVSRAIESGSAAFGFGAAMGLIVLLAALATWRFEWFVWALLAGRPLLDSFTEPETTARATVGATRFPIDPATAVVLLFIGLSLAWVFVQHRAGTWLRSSMTTRALIAFAAIAAIGAPLAWDRAVAVVAVAKIVGGVMMFVVLEQLLTGRPDRARILVIAVFASAIPPLAVGLWQMFMGSRWRSSRRSPGASGVRSCIRIPSRPTWRSSSPSASCCCRCSEGPPATPCSRSSGSDAWSSSPRGDGARGSASSSDSSSRFAALPTRLLAAVLIAVAVVVVAVPSVSGRIADLNSAEFAGRARQLGRLAARLLGAIAAAGAERAAAGHRHRRREGLPARSVRPPRHLRGPATAQHLGPSSR